MTKTNVRANVGLMISCYFHYLLGYNICIIVTFVDTQLKITASK